MEYSRKSMKKKKKKSKKIVIKSLASCHTAINIQRNALYSFASFTRFSPSIAYQYRKTYRKSISIVDTNKLPGKENKFAAQATGRAVYVPHIRLFRLPRKLTVLITRYTYSLLATCSKHAFLQRFFRLSTGHGLDFVTDEKLKLRLHTVGIADTCILCV